jgi:hypothetical protein
MTPHAMTPHLTPEELIDSRERQLPPARQAHAAACGVCRAKLAEIDEVLLDVAAVDVPEPSPLFWDHLSARIRDRVAHEPPPALAPARENPLARLTDWLTGWSAAPRWAFAAVLIALCACLGWLGWSELRRGNGPVAPGLQSVQVDRGEGSAPGPETAVDADDDSEWALMLEMAEDVTWDDADGEGSSLYVRPAAVDRALIELTAEERDRLLQLVQADLARQNQKS